ncbi:transcriptional regulator [Lichenibacterium ramalinae]|uniref:Transcriptional regulator n=2 Tax=Lichenibacterium ramalinae TaxID=2316527 RepID=A0A4Q2RE48_9HYPH|nr:transcriptional regulator [Lichenibacterium ramalinae]
MLTGRQIKEARSLLGLSPSQLATMTGILRPTTVKRAEAANMKQPIADTHMRTIRETLEALGVEFGPDGVRMRAGRHDV